MTDMQKRAQYTQIISPRWAGAHLELSSLSVPMLCYSSFPQRDACPGRERAAQASTWGGELGAEEQLFEICEQHTL